MKPWGEEELRRHALAALGPFGDPLAREALEGAVLSIERDIMRWEGTMGTLRGHRVALALDARLLARATTPATRDSLHSACAVAIAHNPGEALSDLRFLWSGRGAEPRTPYRGPAAERPSVPLNDAMSAYLEASNEPELAKIMARASVSASLREGRTSITFRFAEQDRGFLDDLPSGAKRLAECARALLADGEGHAPELRIAP